ncbi:MAG: MCE family protein [Fimbriimonadaceae bacterium]|nr:MCE family protein [Chitinophagales bacterium]
MATKNKHAIRVGLFIFIGLIFFTVGVLAIGNINKTFTKTFLIKTVFDDVSGLQPGNNIWLSGVKIGTVKEINFNENTQVEVIMKIEKKSQQYIRKNAKAKISSEGLIGNKIIVISGGTPDSAPVENGDALPIEKTYSTEKMMNTLQENNINMLTITDNLKIMSEKMIEGQGTIGKLLNDETLYKNLEHTVATLTRAAENTQELTASVSNFTKKLNEKGGFANDLVTDTIIFNNIRQSVAQLKEVISTADEFANNLKDASVDINNNTNSPLGILLHDEKSAASLKLSIQNLESSTEKLDETMEALQHNFLLKGYFKKKDKNDDTE